MSMDQQNLVDRLLALRSSRARTPYTSLPCVGEAPDALSNPRLSDLVIPIDSWHLTRFYDDVGRSNKHLQFFNTGSEHNVNSSFYLRSFMNHNLTHQSSLLQANTLPHKPNDNATWESLAKTLVEMLGYGLCEFYTHFYPALVGRLNPHKDNYQAGSWKVNIHFSPVASELLVLDETEGRWYALRFPKGVSGYVIDSALFSSFHAVRAGEKNQQSVLAVLDTGISSRQVVRKTIAQAIARVAGAPALALDNDSLQEFDLPAALVFPSVGPKVHSRVGNHRARCAEMLRKAIEEIDPAVAAKTQTSLPAHKRHSWLSQVPRSLVDRAIATLPIGVRDPARKTYENHIKLVQLASYGRIHTRARNVASILAGKTQRKIIDDRMIAIHGVTTVDGQRYELTDYDGTEDKLFRFAWSTGKLYRLNLSPTSSNSNASTLASLVLKLRVRPSEPLIYLRIDGDTIEGETAAMLRGAGFQLRVVRMTGELDDATKRLREIERRKSHPKRKRPVSVKRPTTAWSFYIKENATAEKGSRDLGTLRTVFEAMSPQDKKVYEDRAEADRRRFRQQISELPQTPSCFEIFCSEMSPVLVKQDPNKYRNHGGKMTLTRDLKAKWMQLDRSIWLEYEHKANAMVLKNTGSSTLNENSAGL